mgnify:CR=1 FL=1
MAECPMCDADLNVDDDELDEGDTLICEECGTSLVVSSVDPLEITEADEEFDEIEDDFDDEDDDDEEEEEEEEEEDDPWRGRRRY